MIYTRLIKLVLIGIIIVILVLTSRRKHPPYHEVSDDHRYVSVYLYYYPRRGRGYYKEYKFGKDDNDEFVPYVTESEKEIDRSVNKSLVFMYLFMIAMPLIVMFALTAKSIMIGLIVSIITFGLMASILFLDNKSRWSKAKHYLQKHIDEINIY